jgi:hypothetical protein
MLWVVGRGWPDCDESAVFRGSSGAPGGMPCVKSLPRHGKRPRWQSQDTEPADSTRNKFAVGCRWNWVLSYSPRLEGRGLRCGVGCKVGAGVAFGACGSLCVSYRGAVWQAIQFL